MWKRLNRPSSPTTIRIGNPTLLETTLDEDSAANLKLRDLYPVGGHTDASLGQVAGHSKNLEGSGRHAITYDETLKSRCTMIHEHG